MNDEIAGVDTLALPPLTRPVLQLLFLLVNNIFTHYLSQCCGGALCRSMSPNFNVPNIKVLHINGSLLQP
jgi:hypothetical protein